MAKTFTGSRKRNYTYEAGIFAMRNKKKGVCASMIFPHQYYFFDNVKKDETRVFQEKNGIKWKDSYTHLWHHFLFSNSSWSDMRSKCKISWKMYWNLFVCIYVLLCRSFWACEILFYKFIYCKCAYLTKHYSNKWYHANLNFIVHHAKYLSTRYNLFFI